MNATKTSITIFCLAASSAFCGEAPTITPSSTQVLGVNKTAAFNCSGGESDEPDYGAPCPPWVLDANTEQWTWTVSGSGDIAPDESEATITATDTSQEITLTVNRNDTYTDSSTGARPPTSDLGIPSPDSSNVTIVPVELTDPDPSKKLYYFGGLDVPYPADVEMKLYSIANGQNAPAVFTWSANPAIVIMLSHGQTSNIEHRTSNIEHRTSNIEHRTSNQEPRTKNQEPRLPFRAGNL